MAAYSFQRQFIEPIQAGTKVQTIRAHGKRHHAKVGGQLQLYYAMRTKQCRKIVEDKICTRFDPVRLDFPNRVLFIGTADDIRHHWVMAARDDLDRFAVLDGFENWDALDAFWAEHHTDLRFFDGVMPGWGPGFWV